jgi:predicted metal-dependent phosphoesterase TrpH
MPAAAPAAPLVDLHLHTTASDGADTPASLVAAAAAAGIGVLSVTDHDTTAGWAEAAGAAGAHDLMFVPGIEITSVSAGRDIHVLGYYLDADAPAFQAFLDDQRRDRIRRLHAICEKLDRLGMPIELPALGETVPPGRSLGRPVVADALVAAGFVPDRRAAFDRWIGAGRPAFVPRVGPTPLEAIAIVRNAGGIASLAHPRLIRDEGFVESLAASGELPALEVFHSEHDAAATARYLALARRFNLLVTGGSDFHGERACSGRALGGVSLPALEFQRLHAAASPTPAGRLIGPSDRDACR